MTGGDIKSVQGDTGHAEAEMVTDVYSEIVDEDRRLNALKMEDDFYSNYQKNDDESLLTLLRSLSPETKEKLLKELG